MSNLIRANSAIPVYSLRKITQTLHDSISRVTTGLKVLGGNDAGVGNIDIVANLQNFDYNSSFKYENNEIEIYLKKL